MPCISCQSDIRNTQYCHNNEIQYKVDRSGQSKVESCSMKKLNFPCSWKNILILSICDSDFGFELFPIANLKETWMCLLMIHYQKSSISGCKSMQPFLTRLNKLNIPQWITSTRCWIVTWAARNNSESIITSTYYQAPWVLGSKSNSLKSL